jgi:putative ABC transport system ATP-binding protein
VRLLHELNDDGSTIVVITHDHDIAASLRRQVVLRDGLIEADSSRPARHASDLGEASPEAAR